MRVARRLAMSDRNGSGGAGGVLESNEGNYTLLGVRDCCCLHTLSGASIIDGWEADVVRQTFQPWCSLHGGEAKKAGDDGRKVL